jgi:hypothetical protein
LFLQSSAEEFNVIKRHSSSGRPVGGEAFIQRPEELTGRGFA